MIITVLVGCIAGGTVYGVMANKNKERSKTAQDRSLTNEIYHVSKASMRAVSDRLSHSNKYETRKKELH